MYLTNAHLGICLFLALSFWKYLNARRARHKLYTIPTIGPSGIFSSWLSVFRFIVDGRELIAEGCKKYPGRAFKIPTIDGWTVILNGSNLLDDLRKASDDELSSMEAIEDFLKIQYTMSPTALLNPYHIAIIKSPLTRNIGAQFDDLREEVIAALDQHIPVSDDWVGYLGHQTILRIVVQTSNRLFVGLPLCRDPDFCDLNIQFTIDVAIDAMLIGLFPKFLHPVVGRVLTSRKSSLRRAMKHLAPLFQERMEMERCHGRDWPDKPNDCISWILDANRQLGLDCQRGSIEDMALRVLHINFAAVHTTSMALTHALFHLAANPHLMDPLREEVATVVKQGGWRKESLANMRLLEGFLKESHRRVGAGATGLFRVAMTDVRLSDGSVIPLGTKVAVANYYSLHDESVYPEPDVFKPSRFAREQDVDGSCQLEIPMVASSVNWVAFGIGKHACPGRFFAVNQLKAIFAQVIISYDVRFEEGTEFPASIFVLGNISPNPKARLMFRRRGSGRE